MFAESQSATQTDITSVAALVHCGQTAPLQPVSQDAILAGRLVEHLEHHPHFHGRSHQLHIRSRKGVVRIDGCLPSWYLNQVLQTTLRQVPGVRRICNRVHVRDWDHVRDTEDCDAEA